MKNLKMGMINFWVFSIFLVFCVQANLLNSQNLSCNSNDLNGLNAFMKGLDSGIIGWRSASSDCCSWLGVDCKLFQGMGERVVGLNLGELGLRGVISKSLAYLDQLRVLNLSLNTLEGVLPSELFHLQHLEVLDLSHNKFSGSIPADTDLPSIRIFNISDNSFEGRQPLLVESLNLMAYVIGSNLYSGSVDLRICNTTTQIQILDFSSNRFSGNIPVGLGNCGSLRALSLNLNNLSGNFPDDLFGLSSLRQLHLHDNGFSGQLNTRIRNLFDLIDLDISGNGFSGTIPEIFGDLGKLERFSSHSNNFTGPLPVSLSLCLALRHLDLKNNSLRGRIDLDCIRLVNLSFLDLASNQFHGRIPSHLSSCTELKFISLDRNNFEGQIPVSFKNLQSLTYLSLSNNRLQNISAMLGILQQCRNLTTLVLAMNFQGEEMPIDQIQGFKSLKVLIIPNSRLSGLIPKWLSNCTYLQVLDLSRNLLMGGIPSWVNELHALTYLDLSNNSLTGEIPINLTRLNSLIYDRPFTLCFILRNQQTEKLEYDQFLKLPPSLDLSNNRLIGPIWPEFGKLKQLRILDLSWNNISATIPGNLSGMRNLEILDLSNNNLTGTIPSSLTGLTFLSWFNVANNQLEGVIPTGGQFSTFPNSSFEGNLDLCGEFFLPCSQAQTPLTPGSSNEEEESNGSIIGLPFGIGAVAGFLLSVVSCREGGFMWYGKESFELKGIHPGHVAIHGDRKYGVGSTLLSNANEETSIHDHSRCGTGMQLSSVRINSSHAYVPADPDCVSPQIFRFDRLD